MPEWSKTLAEGKTSAVSFWNFADMLVIAVQNKDGNCDDMDFVEFDLWQVSCDTIFNSAVLTDDKAEAESLEATEFEKSEFSRKRKVPEWRF